MDAIKHISTDSEEFINSNIALIKKYMHDDHDLIKKAQDEFKRLFDEYKSVQHNDQFHGTESLLYHQYVVMQSFDHFMSLLSKDLSESDKHLVLLRDLLSSIEKHTSLGKNELKQILATVPSGCTKDLRTLIFLSVLFHDVGKLYNTERFEKEFEDETLRLRKFQLHGGYGKSFFRFMIASKDRLDTIIDNIIKKTQTQKAKIQSSLEKLQGKDKESALKDVRNYEIDIFYLNKCKDVILRFKDVLDEFELKPADYRFVSFIIEHHQDLLSDPSMPYAKIRVSKDIKELKRYIKWARDKKISCMGIKERSKANDLIFFGSMFMNISDTNGTGFSDHNISVAFKKYAVGDKFEGHHGEISEDTEFFAFLVYLYHNLARSDDEIIENWFGVKEEKKQVSYNFDALSSQFSKEDADLIKNALSGGDTKALNALCQEKKWNMGQIMLLLKKK